MAPTTALDALDARSWPLRLLRASAASTIGLTLAIAGHRLGGGEVTSTAVLTGTLGLVATIAWTLGRRRLTQGQIIGLLLIAQLVVHVSSMIGNAMAPMGPAMIGGHLFATAITGIAMARGECFLWTMAERLGLHVVRFVTARPAMPVRNRAPRVSASDEPRPRDFLFVGGTGLRGPPVGAPLPS